MAKITKVKYFTPEKKALINPENIKLYDKYLKSSIIKNKEVEETTYATYQNNFSMFLVFLAENWDNIELYSEEFFENAIDIIEGYMSFCQETLLNNKKTINNKLAAISSFYQWSVKRRLIDYHPFDGKIERMKGANDERITKDYFLTEEQIELIAKELETNKAFDIQDRILFHLALDSANRVGAISKLTLSSLDLENGLFENIREKRGKRVEVVFDDKCKQLIEEWLEMRKDMDNLEVDALFISRYSQVYKQMSKSTIQERSRKIGKIVGIPDFHMHCFRKTSINNVMLLTNDIELAKEHAGHKSTDTTLIYVKPKSKTEVREKLKQLREKKNKVMEETESESI
jgi:integrase/recombinase XerC